MRAYFGVFTLLLVLTGIYRDFKLTFGEHCVLSFFICIRDVDKDFEVNPTKAESFLLTNKKVDLHYVLV